MKEELYRRAKELTEILEEHATFLNAHAEVGFELEETLNYVACELNKIGIKPSRCGRCGVTGIIEGKRDGKTFLLRADMDALGGLCPDMPGKRIHACGHHMHTAMLLGAAQILFENKDIINGRIKLMFQPAEEILSGALDMIENGVLDAPRPDGAMMLHVIAGTDFPTGNAIVSSGGVSAPSADFFKITVKGKGTHGALAHMGVDPISISAHILSGLAEINSREIAMGEPCALTIGKITGGGSANAIPDSVELEGSLRAFDEKTRENIKNRLCDITNNIAKAFRGRTEIEFTSGCPSLVNDEQLSHMAYQCLREYLGKDKVIMSESGAKTGMRGGSEDFSYISQRIPSIAISIGAGRKSDGYEYPLHNPLVRFDKGALPIGALAYAAIAIKYLNESTAAN